MVTTTGSACKIIAKGNAESVENVVIDEADMLLDDSFVESLSDIFALVKLRYSETNRDQNGRCFVF